MDPHELKRLERFLRKTFANQQLRVAAQNKKTDSAELYMGEEFLGVIYKDVEEGELSYNLSIPILDIDLD